MHSVSIRDVFHSITVMPTALQPRLITSYLRSREVPNYATVIPNNQPLFPFKSMAGGTLRGESS